MSNLLILIPVALFMGLLGLVAFLWSLRSRQYDDMDGAAARILDNDYEDAPLADQADPGAKEKPQPKN